MIKDIIIFSIIIVLIDTIYLRAITPEFSKMVSQIQGTPIKVNINSAIVVYIAMVFLWYTFIYRDLDKKNLRESVIKAGILGICTYAIFDFTNMAIFDKYRLDLSLMDSVWGGILFSLSTYLLSIIKQNF